MSLSNITIPKNVINKTVSSLPSQLGRNATSLKKISITRSSSSSTVRPSPVLASAIAAAPAAAGRPSAIVNSDKASQKPTVIITGASSGLGLNTAASLAKSGDWHVVMACRDFSKAQMKAKQLGFPKDSYSIMHLDLASFESIRQFVTNFRASGRRVDAFVANAAIYLPTATEPTFTADGFETCVGVNHLGHFLLCNLMMEDLINDKELNKPTGAPRMVIVGSITGNTNTLAGNVPPKADLGDLSGLASGDPTIDGKEFIGAKAYKDSKVCNMLTMREMHRRFHDQTGVTFASMYPGCIAETGLFRNHTSVFKTLFPPFQKYITKGYISEEDAGRRLAAVVADPKLSKSGVYWSFNEGTSAFENQVSDEVADDAKGVKLWEISEKLCGLA